MPSYNRNFYASSNPMSARTPRLCSPMGPWLYKGQRLGCARERQGVLRFDDTDRRRIRWIVRRPAVGLSQGPYSLPQPTNGTPPKQRRVRPVRAGRE